MDTIQCKQCKAINNRGSSFCKTCGEPLVEAIESRAQVINEQSASAQLEPASEVEEKYENLSNIKRIYKFLTAIVAIGWLLLVIRTYTYTESLGWAITAALILSPIVFTVGAQAEKIDISISQEKSVRECVYYLKRISKQLERADRH